MNKNIFINLNWNLPLDLQEKAINEIALIDNLNPKILIQPLDKEYWENAAKVLYKMGYPRIEKAIPGLFAWLQDMNWPGVTIVIEILKSLPKDILVKYLEYAVEEALSGNDEIWLANLAAFLSELNIKKDDFKVKEVYYSLLDAEDF